MTTSQTQQTTEAFKKMLTDQIARLEAMQAEAAKMEEKTANDAQAWIDEWAKLARESMTYATQISAEWRKMSLEATKRTFEMMNAGK